MTEEEAAGVDREVARELEDLVGEAREVIERGRVAAFGETGAREGFVLDGAVMREVLGGAIERGLGDAERLADVAHGGARAVADDVADHRGVIAAVDRVDVLDHFFAALVLDVEIDVGRLGALAREEALEQEAHADRIDRGDAEAEADGRVRGRAAALAHDVAPPAVRHDLVHRQEVARVVELLDHARARRRAARGRSAGCRRRSATRRLRTRACAGTAAEVRAVGQALGRIAIAQLAERERAARGDVERARDRAGLVGVELVRTRAVRGDRARRCRGSGGPRSRA